MSRAGTFPKHEWMVLLVIILILLAPLTTAKADPPDMYAQSLSIVMDGDGLHLDWKILPGPVISDATWQAADLNHDGSVSPAEAQTWLSSFIGGLSGSLDGVPAKFELQSIHWPASVVVLRTGEDPIEIRSQFNWPTSVAGRHSLMIHNAYIESNSLNWFSLSGQQGLSFDRPSQNNGQLDFNFYLPSPAASGPVVGAPKLISWNSGTPNLPLLADAISRMAGNLATPGQNPATQGQANNPNIITSALIGLVKAQQFSPLFYIGAFFLSLLLGSLHALTPGHGKTLVGAYLIGSKGRAQDAVFLGLIVTLTHTGSVLLLGLITLIATHYVLPTLITPWLEAISGVLVIGFGINLLIQRRADLNSLQSRKLKTKMPHITAPGGREHLAHRHNASEQHTHPGAKSSAHAHTHRNPVDPLTRKSLLGLGISGGLVPCPDAIAILLVAVAINRIPLGMLLIVAFSIGLALILILIGIAMVQGARVLARNELLTRFGVYTPVISAVVVSGLGLALTINALNSFRFSSNLSQSGFAQSSAPAASSSSQMKLLYVMMDNQGRDQLFMTPFAGGNTVQYTQEPHGIENYTISPDHKTILYIVYKPDGSGSSVWAMNSDGTQKRLALDCPQSECDSPQWYPDSENVVYLRLDGSQASALPRFSIWWLDILTGKTQPVFQDQSFPGTSPRFAPDGQWLSYISGANNMLMLYHLKDTRSISIPLVSQQVIPESWSPAGDSLLYGDQTSSPSGTYVHLKRYLMGSGQTVDLGASGAENDYSGAWSPKGNLIAIDRDSIAADGVTVSNQVWLSNPDGSGARVLLNGNNLSYSNLSWSPDGKFIVYSRYSYQFSAQSRGHFDVYAADIQTGREILLAPGGDLPTAIP
jgi:nickel/cobalt transporter (NicO) family protein